jgi:thiosulfate/3-mercaptopyruvate sulfurtransferase
MNRFLAATEVAAFPGRILDCRFSLMDPHAGLREFRDGHIPGARHLDLATAMAGPVGPHGGRHPLPECADFAGCLAELGIDRDTPVLLYDDAQGLYAARAWWMMRALGYREPQILAGGYAAWRALASTAEAGDGIPVEACAVPAVPETWPGIRDREDIARAQARGARLVDAREAPRYRGEVEPIDPVAGHIPGAENRPWKGFVDADAGLCSASQQRELWGDLLEADELVVYCGSGVSACVNLLSLAELGYDGARLYPGSWSDWCSYLATQKE